VDYRFGCGVCVPDCVARPTGRPAKREPEYTPATNALPYLEKNSLRNLRVPLMPFVYNWEHPGPWFSPMPFHRSAEKGPCASS